LLLAVLEVVVVAQTYIMAVVGVLAGIKLVQLLYL
jgi:hypothetical protein